MKTIEDQFIPYELALKLKELGFDERCLAGYYNDGKNLWFFRFHKNSEREPIVAKRFATAPLWQQAFDWFEREHFAYSHIYPEFIGSDEWEYAFKIDYLPREKQGLKRRGTSFECIESFELGVGSYTGAWSDKIKARQACLEKLIQILEEKK